MPELRFAFGKNWKSFVEHAFDERRLGLARASLQRLLGAEDLRGRSFLDVGCGSGLFSLAALSLGAQPVVSFDYDRDSVGAAKLLRERAGIPEARWSIGEGSILDDRFVAGLARADVVYAWGVLHHTGDMWRAIDRAASLVRDGGQLAIAIYNDVEGWFLGSRMWWHFKRAYVAAPPAGKRLAEGVWTAAYVARRLALGKNPFAEIARYAEDGARGMDFWHDMRDWLGGFPYEYATAGEVFRRVRERFGFELEYLDTHDGHGCNELTFRAPT